jgi:preprotein translocase subunit SecB
MIILKKNSVAIMFPFIRSQVSLITTQPGMIPVQLPLVDVNKMVK